MTSYESDSSEDGSIYPTTNVMLGYASKEPTDDPFSQLGGSPTWPDSQSYPSADLAICKTCNNLMSLLLQLNGDLPERLAGHERRLYIFACRNRACRRKNGSIRAIRGVKEHAAQKASSTTKASSASQVAAPRLGDTIFASSRSSSSPAANPFAQSSSNTIQNPFASQPASQGNPFAASNHQPSSAETSQNSSLSATFAQKAQISTPSSAPSPRSPWPTTSLPKPYPSYHLDADYETLSNSNPSSSGASAAASASNQRTEFDADDTASSSALDKETFESTLDKPFQIFSDRLAQNPEQILRYEFGGHPLLYSRTDAVGSRFTTSQAKGAGNAKVRTQGAQGIPTCEHCGKGRVFELQLVPHAITELEVEEDGIDGMEWGTVILGVCGVDCVEKGVGAGEWGWVEEWVGVQWEEVGRIEKG